MEVEKLIDVYHNSLNAEAFCLIFTHQLKCDFVLIAWHLSENLWYMPFVYNKQLIKLDNYLDEKPDLFNIPIKSNNMRLIDYGETVLICNLLDDLDKKYSFACESFLNKLAEEDKLRRDKYRKSLLLSNMCHAIRTPLNGILHMTNLLLASNRMVKDTELANLNSQHLNYLNDSSQSLANSIFDIIDMNQLQIGKFALSKTVFNLRDMVNNAIAIVQPLANKPDVSLQYHVDDVVPKFVYSDGKRMKQVLVNLLQNAFAHTAAGEIILYVTATMISDEESNDDIDNDQYEIQFTIHDNGAQIDPKIARLLFKPPEILCNAEQYSIALRVSYLLAKKLGGNIRIETSSVGNTFAFVLTVYEEEPPEYDQKTLTLLKGKRVLLISRESSDRISLSKLLDKYEMIHTIASSYEEVFAIHMEKKYDLVICGNVEITEQLRTIWRETKFLGLTNDISIMKGIFHEVLPLPIDDDVARSKLIEIFNKQYNVSNDVKILIVEDERINQIVLERLLRMKKYDNVSIANNGEEAMSMIKVQEYDVMLLDIRMPGMSGFELAEKIRVLYNGKKCPKIIGVTAQMILDEDPIHLLDDYVHKPIDIDLLDKKIKM